MKKVETSKVKVTEEVKNTPEVKELKEAFALWNNTAKSGSEYLTGKCEDMKLIGFFNKEKKNEKEPDIRIYIIENDEISKEAVASLWKNISKGGNYYLSGTDNENNKLVGFYNTKFIEFPNRPFIRVYYSEQEIPTHFYYEVIIMTKSELIILKQLNEIDDLKKRIEELETVLIEVKALMYKNDIEWGTSNYDFLMKELDRVIKE